MLRGLYTAAAGMVAQQHRHDTVTNNISNINTTGYKQNNAVTRSFPDMLLSLTGVKEGEGKVIGHVNTGVFAEESLQINLQGDLTQTNRSNDFAILSDIAVPGITFDASGKYVAPTGETTFQPQAFFTVQDIDGQTRYTRNGSFNLDQQGFLTLSDGSKVLGTNGAPIKLQPGTSMDNLTLNKEHQLINSATGASVGQLLITRVDNPNELIREGNGKFTLKGNGNNARAIAANDRVEVRQGYVERSNVDPSQSMVDLMSAARAYEANQKVIQFYDKSLDKAVNEVGRI
ncbi:flagellar hook-basal body complex protein FlhO [Paenibacillus baekrokdamisoli]|uniref:Flagellar hook-basal body complex protein FlhO n=1 Tax=Paenibacillus baekrokdamisoli TaxID=1712516 RepID=A0A3G9JIG4_9BACL|nr:flagellar hook-basal body protein [Paenibacillus baekrokdamisoli]MBB3069060.1 flagellar basal-body rod protein FlgG [Paenibacillus baekrokdamisoli]BBH23878.1 flagellar hook-basal body complex protein FlhO [Paenibacillus baekrokdamisoli]